VSTAKQGGEDVVPIINREITHLPTAGATLV
jgi:hypothetical protein